MARLFDSMKYNKDERGADIDEGTRLELRRLANLFSSRRSHSYFSCC